MTIYLYLQKEKLMLSEGLFSYLAFIETIEVKASPKVLKQETLVIIRQPWHHIITVNISQVLNLITIQ